MRTCSSVVLFYIATVSTAAPTCNDPNAIYKKNGSGNCPPMCDVFKRNSSTCISTGDPACECKDGYALSSPSANGRCIPKKECPKPCSDSNAVYKECGSGNCPPMCIAFKNASIPCFSKCDPACECKDGYALESNAKNAKCIPKDKCSKSCVDPNAVYKQIGSGNCPPICDVFKNASVPCFSKGDPACECKDGFLLSSPSANGKCIPKKDCPKPCKDPNAVYKECGSGNCPPVCPMFSSESEKCSSKCDPACECKDGFVFSSRDKRATCVPQNQCPVP